MGFIDVYCSFLGRTHMEGERKKRYTNDKWEIKTPHSKKWNTKTIKKKRRKLLLSNKAKYGWQKNKKESTA